MDRGKTFLLTCLRPPRCRSNALCVPSDREWVAGIPDNRWTVAFSITGSGTGNRCNPAIGIVSSTSNKAYFTQLKENDHE